MAALQRMKPEGLVYPLPGAKPPESVFTESKGLEGRLINPNRTLQSWFTLGLERRVFEHEHEHEHEHELKLKLKLKYWSGRGEGAGSIWFQIHGSCDLPGNNKTSKTQANLNNKPNIINIIGRCKSGF